MEIRPLVTWQMNPAPFVNRFALRECLPTAAPNRDMVCFAGGWMGWLVQVGRFPCLEGVLGLPPRPLHTPYAIGPPDPVPVGALLEGEEVVALDGQTYRLASVTL